MRATTLALSGCLLLSAAGGAPAQEPAAPQAPAPAQAAEPGAEAPADGVVQGFVYDAAGRRDPFVSLVRRGVELEPDVLARRGLEALAVDAVALRGVLASPLGFVALVEGADGRTYIVRAGDQLLDGTVERIAAEEMVIRQQVDDPLSLETEREVRKTLRQTEEAAP